MTRPAIPDRLRVMDGPESGRNAFLPASKRLELSNRSKEFLCLIYLPILTKQRNDCYNHSQFRTPDEAPERCFVPTEWECVMIGTVILRRNGVENMFFVALLVIVLLMWKFLAFRAYMLFQMTLFAPVLIFVGAVHLGNQEYPAVGMAMLIFGNVLALLSVLTFWLSGRKIQPGYRWKYYGSILLYGGSLFLRLLLICLIIGIPFMKWLTGNVRHFHEATLLNGATVMVDENLRDMDGNQYREL